MLGERPGSYSAAHVHGRAAIANDGVMMEPGLLLKAASPVGETVAWYTPKVYASPVNKHTADLIADMMAERCSVALPGERQFEEPGCAAKQVQPRLTDKPIRTPGLLAFWTTRLCLMPSAWWLRTLVAGSDSGRLLERYSASSVSIDYLPDAYC